MSYVLSGNSILIQYMTDGGKYCGENEVEEEDEEC